MNKGYTLLLLLAIYACTATAQSFRKGSLLLSMSEGYLNANYSTTNTADNEVTKTNVNGNRDPLTVEYGLTKHWGVGVNIGGDIIHVNPAAFYNFNVPANSVKVITSEVTADVHYHFFVTQHTDISAFASFGGAGVNITGKTGDGSYQYQAGGNIVRAGGEARYYVTRRFGFLAMLSAYSMSCSTGNIKGNTVGEGYTTGITGYALEFGICLRLLK